MTAVLTTREQAALDAIRKHVEGRGYPPTFAELGAAIGLSSKASVHKVLTTLQAKGVIRREPGEPRAITIVGGGR